MRWWPVQPQFDPNSGQPALQAAAPRGWAPLLLFVLLTALVTAVAVVYYRHESARLHAEQVRSLQTVADFKRGQLEGWVEEHERQARVWERGSMLAELAGRRLAGGVKGSDRSWLTERLETVRVSLGGEAISLLDLKGAVQLQTAEHPISADLLSRIPEAIASGRPQWVDFYRDPKSARSDIHLDLLVPLYPRSGEHPFGLLAVHFDPGAFLFPLIKSWPAASATAESLLVRREGDRMVYLNDLRHRAGTALMLSMPLTAGEVPAVMAAQGITGIVQGKDYRGQSVRAVIMPVAGTPWKLICKIDREEIDAPLHREALHIAMMALILLLTLGGMTYLWWRRARAEQEARYWESEMQRRVLTRRLDYLARYAHDIILLVGADGRLADANDRALYTYGYERNELIGLPIRELRPPKLQTSQVEPMLLPTNKEGIVYESEHRKKSGESFPVEVSARRIDESGEVLVVVRDISERKRSEAQLRLAARVFDGSHEGILVTDADARIVAVNAAFTQITGYSAEEVLGEDPSMLKSGRQDRAFYQTLWESLEQNGIWQGEIWNRRKDGGIFPEWLAISAVTDEQGNLLNYVGIFSDITERKATQAHLEFLAHHDPLTGLPNRTLLLDRIDTAMTRTERSQQQIGVLFIDLDRFKLINDSLGHLIGDQVLCRVAERLQHCLRSQDTLSRIGGDEFVALLNGIRRVGDVARVADKIFDSFQEPMIIDDHPLTISPSVGIALYPDGEVVDAERLIQNADTAMYQAKSAGRNTYCFFTADLNHQAQERLRLEGELRAALRSDQFEVHYQPQMDIADGRLIGFEALLRWRRPDGLVLPEQFVPLAEDTGLILPMGERLLEMAARQFALWRRAGRPLHPIAINLSAKQFRSPGLAERMRAILERCEVAPGYIELELAESYLIDPVEMSLTTILALKDAGFRLVLDDFGIGYSSLNDLKRFPFDALKIDRSFVSSLPSNSQNAAIVKAMLEIADGLGCQVIAEGVETREQLDFLAALGCRRYQGFLASAPVPAAETDRLLDRMTVNHAA